MGAACMLSTFLPPSFPLSHTHCLFLSLSPCPSLHSVPLSPTPTVSLCCSPRPPPPFPQDVLLIENDINTAPFSPAVHECVPPLPWAVTEADVADPTREDLRHLDICSVDPPGCKDIDDALHVRCAPCRRCCTAAVCCWLLWRLLACCSAAGTEAAALLQLWGWRAGVTHHLSQQLAHSP